MFSQPFEKIFDKATNILIAGMGGGFDVYHGLPLYFALREVGKSVTLVNLTFSFIEQFDCEMITESLAKLSTETDVEPDDYFPEFFLAQWFEQEMGASPTIYAQDRVGVQPMLANYRWIVATHEIDTIVWVDGGTDSLMCGHEDGLGTPFEDVLSLAVGSLLDVDQQLLMSVGFGVDHYHGVSNDLSLAAIAELTQQGCFLGSLPLLANDNAVESYISAVEFSTTKMSTHPSIVASSIVSAIQGYYGNHHANHRTKGSKLWINPMMAMLFFFDLAGVAKRNLMIESLYMTEYYDQVVRQITIFQRMYIPERRLRAQLPN